MRVFIVGGAVRDKLLKRPYTDKDFVVVGATPEQMIDAGFIQVGADFPVFLHPKTKEEYALARTERKSGKGYKGFEVHAAPEVTLEQDLMRRDLTINAMAIEVKGLMDNTPISGEVIDPYGGIEDIKNKVLRHVSDAFSEDPLRVLRIARFYGRFYQLNAEKNFRIAEDTLALIDTINNTDELQHLTAERVWQETSRALMQDAPQAYFDCLLQTGSLSVIMPTLATAWLDESNKRFIFDALALSGQLKLPLHKRWAILMLSFAGQSINSPIYAPLGMNQANQHAADSDYQQWNTEQKKLAAQLKAPKKVAQFSQSYINCYPYLTQYERLSAEDVATLIGLTKADKDFGTLSEIMALHHVVKSAYQKIELGNFVAAYQQITIQDIDSCLQGSAIGDALNVARIDSIAKIL